MIHLTSQFCVCSIVANHINWHRENVQTDRENTGNLKM